MSAILTPGTTAPDFNLPVAPDKKLSLSELRGKPVILAFYPADWSPVCGDQMALYNEVLPEFQKHGAQLVGISVDGVWCHAAFAKDHNLHFPLAADFEPKGAVARAYGVYRQEAVSANGHSSSSTRTGSSPGAICRPFASIPARTESSRHWKNCQIGANLCAP